MIEYEYDTGSSSAVRSRGNLLTRTRTPAPGYYADQSTLVDSWTYHATFNTVTSHTPPKGSSHTVTYGFDSFGNRTLITYPDVTIDTVWGGGTQAASETFEYYGIMESGGFAGQLKAREWPGGRRDEYTYDNNGYLDTKTVDVGTGTHHNLVTDYDYDSAGNLIGREDPRGARTEFVVNELNQVVRKYLPSSTAGQVDMATYVDMRYDVKDNLEQVDVRNVDELGNVGSNGFFTTEYEYDVLDNLLVMRREIDEGGSGIVWTEEVYDYDANENRTLIEFGEEPNQAGNAVAYIYDERDLLYKTIRGPGTSGESTDALSYDGNENVVLSAQGLEGTTPRATFMVVDGYDRPRITTDAEGNKRVMSYDANSNLAQEYVLGELLEGTAGSTSGNVPLSGATYTYDERDRRVEVDESWIDPATGSPIGDGSRTTSLLLNEDSRVVKVRDDNGHVTESAYDTVRRKSVVTDAAGNTTEFDYDDSSNVIEIEQEEFPNGGGSSVVSTVAATYDLRDRKLTATDEASETTTFSYDSRNNLVKEVDRRGNITTTAYDGLSRPLSRDFELRSGGTGAGLLVETNTIEWEWDLTSRLKARVDGEGNRTEYDYDPLNRRTLTTYADGTTDDPVFDVHDNVTARTDANGSAITTTYDLLNRPKTRSVTPASGVQGSTSETYGYDGLSRVVSALNDDSLVEREFDSLSNLLEESISVSGGTAAVTTFEHDGVGNVTEIGYPGGRDIARLYDELNQLSEVKEGATSLAEFDWQAPGRLKEITRLNGTTTDYTYDTRRRINGVTHANTSGTLSDWDFEWDEEDNKVERSDVLKSFDYAYEYDSLNRLVESTTTNPYLTTWEFDYDLANNRESRTVGGVTTNYTLSATAPSPADKQVNQYTKVPAGGGTEDELVYDANGNLKKRKVGGLVKQEVTYDYRNQMVTYELPNGTTHEYQYDAFGRRVGKVLNSQGTPNIFRYAYSGAEVIEERTASGVTRATFVLGATLDQPLSMQRSNSDYYYHADDQGSVMLLTSSSGAVVESYDYTDFGRPVDGASYATLQSSTVDNPYYFTGRRRDDESKWYYYRTRYFVPKWGRFTTRDSIGIWGDSGNRGNGLTYTNNNPWSIRDPFGEAGDDGYGFWDLVWDCTPIAPDVVDLYQGYQTDDSLRMAAGGAGLLPWGKLAKIGRAITRFAGLGRAATKAAARAGDDVADAVGGAVRAGGDDAVSAAGRGADDAAEAADDVTDGARSAADEGNAGSTGRGGGDGTDADAPRSGGEAADGNAEPDGTKGKGESGADAGAGSKPGQAPDGPTAAAGSAPDRGGLTKAGRAVEKHGSRPGSVFPKAVGNVAQKNLQGQIILDDIMDNVTRSQKNRFGGYDFYGGEYGGGARYNGAGEFMGFLEP